MRAKAEASLAAAKAKMADAEAALLVRPGGSQATDVYVHENPWKRSASRPVSDC